MAKRTTIPAIKLPDSVRENLIASLWVMHAIILVLALAVIFGKYDVPTLTVIGQMFASTLFAIAGTAAILVGDRVGKNLTQEPVTPVSTTSVLTTTTEPVK